MAVRIPRDLATRDPELLAPLAGLRYVQPEPPGWTRRRRGKGFSFIDESGKTIREPERLRLSGLAVPPAWQDVWFAPVHDGYLQATGIDDAGRKQYRYHDDYRALCEARKFERIKFFGRALPGIRTYISHALEAPPLSRTLAVGAVLGVIDVGLVRVGNEQSADDGHHGATTLAADHLEDDGHILLEYVGKSGKNRSVLIDDEQLADIAKDFRTWGGSRIALEGRVRGLGKVESIDATADALGNTRAVARSSYVHPKVLDASEDEIADIWRRSRRTATSSRADRALYKLLNS